jgi:uncharacterized membrane protein
MNIQEMKYNFRTSLKKPVFQWLIALWLVSAGLGVGSEIYHRGYKLAGFWIFYISIWLFALIFLSMVIYFIVRHYRRVKG